MHRVIWYLVLAMLAVIVILIIAARDRLAVFGPVAGSWHELIQWFE